MDSPYEYNELSDLQQIISTEMEWMDIATPITTPKMSSSSFSLNDEWYGPSSTREEQLGSTGIGMVVAGTGGGDDLSEQQLREKRSSHQMIGLEDLKRHFGKPRAEAAKCLQVSIPTLKRMCRKNGILRWPYFNRKKKNMVLQPEPETEIQPPPVKVSTEERGVIVKVQYGDNFIKFEISSLLKVADLKVEISKRLKLKVGSFDIRYLDDEGDWILIEQDVDLSLSMRSVGIKTIKMMVLPSSN